MTGTKRETMRRKMNGKETREKRREIEGKKETMKRKERKNNKKTGIAHNFNFISMCFNAILSVYST